MPTTDPKMVVELWWSGPLLPEPPVVRFVADCPHGWLADAPLGTSVSAWCGLCKRRVEFQLELPTAAP